MKDIRSDKMKPQIFTVAGKRIKSIFYPDFNKNIRRFSTFSAQRFISRKHSIK